MSQLLAPYNNAMRLGQGFNSYTQQICLDRAVVPGPIQENTPTPRELLVTGNQPLIVSPERRYNAPAPDADQPTIKTPPAEGVPSEEGAVSLDVAAGGASAPQKKDQKAIKVYPWVKPQIVTYSSRFVDKLSDVTDAMNISGSLSIKTSTIGGKASGSYVDSDKFKSSDINFHLQVRVTNQIHDAKNYNVFNKIEGLDGSRFSEVYGDSFISGWEEGGELNAIVSIKVLDKSKIFQVKAAIEAEMTTPSIAGAVKAQVEIAKSSLNKETETTVAVNWSGGGSIKDPLDDWTIDNLKRAAAAFPDLVAITPQRTYAILTKYTALEDFHLKNRSYDVLSYENAGIYTGQLLDSFMDYKMLWKQISNASFELEANRATIDMGEISEEMASHAKVKAFSTADDMVKRRPVLADASADTKQQPQSTALVPGISSGSTGNTGSEQSNPDNTKTIKPFMPSFAGLIEAKKICRAEMAKIVKEVDLVAKDPLIATQANRDDYFLNPLVFKQLLPIVRSLSPENAVLGVRDPSAALILGYSQPKTDEKALPPVHNLDAPLLDHCNMLLDTIKAVAYKARDYRMQGCVGPITNDDVHSLAYSFNDLQKLDQTYRLVDLDVFSDETLLKGIKTRYANGTVITHGLVEGSPSHSLRLDPNGSEVIVEVVVREGVRLTTEGKETGRSFLHSIAVSTSFYQTLDTAKRGTGEKEEKEESTKRTDMRIMPRVWLRPEDTRYSLRGFFGLEVKGQISTLGVVWGKDGFVPVPSTRIQTAICKSFLGLSKELQYNVLSLDRRLSEVFLMGKNLSVDVPANSTVKSFNCLQTIDRKWTIRSIDFATNNNGKLGGLSGLKVTYGNGEEILHGGYRDEDKDWGTTVQPLLSVAKIVSGRVNDTQPVYIDSVEFVAGEKDSENLLPDWPLDLLTTQWEGKGNVRVKLDVAQLVELAPNFGNGFAKWSARGFYGEYDETRNLITRLGIVWGRG
ncbi:unnamed protein product [Clonostachys rosea]|uniref:MACPF domain-containing protein n=1 Tax=Bionectria ochroleuca TaxID=29856 RepID=A0ABY6V427_BIOOC|nr:unnamed protein product [Clonostachys rosea]